MNVLKILHDFVPLYGITYMYPVLDPHLDTSEDHGPPKLNIPTKYLIFCFVARKLQIYLVKAFYNLDSL